MGSNVQKRFASVISGLTKLYAESDYDKEWIGYSWCYVLNADDRLYGHLLYDRKKFIIILYGYEIGI